MSQFSHLLVVGACLNFGRPISILSQAWGGPTVGNSSFFCKLNGMSLPVRFGHFSEMLFTGVVSVSVFVSWT